MAISKVTKDLRKLLDAQNIPWEDHSGFSYGKTWTDRSNACVEHIYFKSRGNWVSVLYGDDIRGFPHKFLVWEMSNYSYLPRVMDVEKIIDKYF